VVGLLIAVSGGASPMNFSRSNAAQPPNDVPRTSSAAICAAALA